MLATPIAYSTPELAISFVEVNRVCTWTNLFRVTRMRPDIIMLEEPNASVAHQITWVHWFGG